MTRDHETTDADDRTGTDSNDGSGRVDRRDYLRLIGGVGMAGAAESIAGTATAQSGDWEAAADQRIREHRQGPLTVEVVDTSGRPVPDATVDVEMQSHDYWFGYVLSADLLVNQTEPGHPYREALKEDFNVVWFGNYHKWRFFEENQETSDRATAWAKDNGLDVRGHVCLWGNVDAWAVPADVVDAMGLDHESGQNGPDLDPQYVRDRTFDHVRTIIDHYADFEYDGTSYGSVIEEWEVMNEVPHKPGLIRAVNGVPADEEASDIDPVTAPVLAEWYRHADDIAPEDVGTATNDYNVITANQYAGDDYERQIQFLAENAGLDFVGLQSHFGDRASAISSETAMAVMDRYARHGVRLRVTEFDVTGDDWSDEAKADWFHEYFKTVFSHPATDAFLVAGGSDAHHWRDDAPFFYDDWSPKPAYDVYRDLVFGEWWTSESTTTDGEGTATVDAFLGTHEVRVTAPDGTTRTATTSVTDSDAGAQVTVTVDASRPTPTPDGPSWPTDPRATDPDGDGLYEDLSGDGTVNFPDVNKLFQNSDTANVRDNAQFYDFESSGDINLQDVMALFGMV